MSEASEKLKKAIEAQKKQGEAIREEAKRQKKTPPETGSVKTTG